MRWHYYLIIGLLVMVVLISGCVEVPIKNEDTAIIIDITITTDKKDYEQEEIVNIIVKNLNKTFNTSAEYSSSNPTFNIYHLNGSDWVPIIIYFCENVEGCVDGKITIEFVECYTPPKDILYDLGKFEWNQREIISEIKSCDGIHYKDERIRKVSSGRYKAEFCYTPVICYMRDFKDRMDVKTCVTTERKCIETEFTIKEKIAIEPITVKHSGGAGLLIAECANKTHIKENSDYIIEGIVEQVESKWNEEKTSIFTYTDLSIGKYVKGTPFETNKMEIITDGGCVDEICQAVEDTPILHEGKNVRIYFEKINEDFFIVCGQFGVEENIKMH